MQKIKLSDALTLGFALFAMFFGAGNLIFPPYLGYTSGDNWFIGFLCFITADAVLSLVALFVIAKVGHGISGITEVLGNKLSKLYLALACLCIGPFIAIPRTGAITYEIGVRPLMGCCSSFLVTGIFFLICLVLSIRRAKVVDVIGRFLSPLMFIALLVLIAKGIIHPIGNESVASDLTQVIKDGVVSGYQTMDMMGAAVLSMAIVFEITNKGYRDSISQFKIITLAGIVSALLLFMVYGGLAKLGDTAAGVYPPGLTQTELLTKITWDILGKTGLIILSIIVASACLTTAIGLLTSVSSYFSELLDNKIKYEVFVVIFTVFSWIISNFGIATIISIAAPILEIMYPVLIVLTATRLFASYIDDNIIYKLPALVTVIVSALSTIGSLIGVSLGADHLPLASLGFEWVLPAILSVIVAVAIASARKKSSK
ncbi:MAG: branched-chain amino acid transport system II carrier protein [Firmicutes bacterium]|nr:branched-chain amino acid transport system II carrier protein [Bacillota bacterium]